MPSFLSYLKTVFARRLAKKDKRLSAVPESQSPKSGFNPPDAKEDNTVKETQRANVPKRMKSLKSTSTRSCKSSDSASVKSSTSTVKANDLLGVRDPQSDHTAAGAAGDPTETTKRMSEDVSAMRAEVGEADRADPPRQFGPSIRSTPPTRLRRGVRAPSPPEIAALAPHCPRTDLSPVQGLDAHIAANGGVLRTSPEVLEEEPKQEQKFMEVGCYDANGNLHYVTVPVVCDV
eukprot:CAMPEP_0202807902 /NCGR_PEP_ID=MMETSP1389-20130828/534_1 /ASSEMBLY_ACC=CAM_ASM_000865 /TAXON_ID=302021 /ORGANISM="Rhodomonas sp., Strain CCMP768" /LENGTH=232 /DNA_ID=CAMNT_0049478043 /DNA_START=28 /DNA_END=726 /DNA_ORIENTATION=+